MKIKKPIRAKSTERIMKAVLPSQFKMVNDKESNGYKYINLLFGVEIDEIYEKLQEAYNNSFISSIDLSKEGILYEVYLDGIPKNDYLSDGPNGTKIKIVEDYEFNNGDPTRIIYNGELILKPGHINGVGLDYQNIDYNGNGVYILGFDNDMLTAFNTDDFTNFIIKIDGFDNVISEEGNNPGIKTQSYEISNDDEILNPLTIEQLPNIYPLTRTVNFNGTLIDIDHYEPYNGYIEIDENNIIANTNYNTDHYYDENGKKVFYRTASNNPYGYNNYNIAYVPLKYSPIPNTLKLYDIDIIDSNGNATEIPIEGKNLYSYGEYVGFSPDIPIAFQDEDGPTTATDFITISWDYLYEGTKFNENTLQWDITNSGNTINMLKIVNPTSRYIVEYKYLEFDKVYGITSRETTNNYRKYDEDPVFMLYDDKSYDKVDFKFTNDPLINDNSIITFDGKHIRPNSNISKLQVNLPVIYSKGDITKYICSPITKKGIGYSNEYVPNVINDKIDIFEYFFKGLTGNYVPNIVNSGTNKVFPINYDTYIGKRLYYISDEMYYSFDDIFPDKDIHIKAGFRFYKKTDIILIDYKNDNYSIKSYIKDNIFITEINSKQYLADNIFNYDMNSYEIIYRILLNDKMDIYLSNGGIFSKIKLSEREINIEPTENKFHVFKNGSIDVGYIKGYI